MYLHIFNFNINGFLWSYQSQFFVKSEMHLSGNLENFIMQQSSESLVVISLTRYNSAYISLNKLIIKSILNHAQ